MKRFLQIIVWLIFVMGTSSGFSQSGSTSVVISEVYGGGGNSGATHKNDFIELYNLSSNSVNLAGWSVQYNSATGSTTWQVTLLTGTIAAGGYYLVQEAGGAGNGISLPTADALGSIAMSLSTGKVALVNSTIALTGAAPTSATIIDRLGFGPTATAFEGAPTAVLASNTSVERKLPCIDSNNNVNDFKIGTPTPQNSSSTISPLGFTVDYPKIQLVTSSGFQILTNLNNFGKTYFVILAVGSAPPTPIQVRAGQDGNGHALGTDFKGSVEGLLPNAEYTVNVVNLQPLTAYDVYSVNDRCNSLSSTALIHVITLTNADTTPPVNASGYPKVQNIAGSGFQVVTNLNESGTTYFIVLQNASATPTPGQVRAGQDDTDAALAINLFGSISVINSDTEYTASVSGLMKNTSYSVFFVSQDAVANPNLQTSASQVNVLTAVEYDENFDTCNGMVGSFSRISITGAQIWDCTSFGSNNTNGVQINGGTSTGSSPNEDWLISPKFTVASNANFSFDNKKDYSGLDITLKISADYDGVSDPSAATWTDLTFTKSTNGDGNSTGSFVSSGLLSLSAYNGQSIYLAFVYTSGSAANTGARWTIDNFTITNAAVSFLNTSTISLGNFGYTKAPSASNSRSFNITALGLLSEVIITAPPDFEVSKDGIHYDSTFNFSLAEASTSPIVYVRFKPTSGIGVVLGNVTVINRNKTITISVMGTEGIDPRTKTFDVACYNLEFFGTDIKDASGKEFGPANDPLQVTNVSKVLNTLGADIYGVEEISDDNAFSQLVATLPGYGRIVSDSWSYSWQAPDQYFPPQKVGFIYDTSTVQIISSRPMFKKLYDEILAGTVTLPNYPGASNSNFWSSGRLPFMLTADVTINGVKKRIRLIDVHAKSGSASDDYARRQYDVQVLHDSLIINYSGDNIILIGDFNDDVEGSIYTGHDSSYKVFVDDLNNYKVLTDSLSLADAYSFPSSGSFLDHMIISNELTSSYVSKSISIDDPRNYVVNYSATTSDHLPVMASFSLVGKPQIITFNALSDKTVDDVPFRLTAIASSDLAVTYVSSDPSIVSISGMIVTILKAGTVNIVASQAGDLTYEAAPGVSQSLVIKKASQTITFGPLASKTLGDEPFALGATSTSSLAVSYSTTSDKITLAGGRVTLVKAGRATITANQPGNDFYKEATSLNQSFCIAPAKPTIKISNTNTPSPTLASSTATGNQWYLNGVAISGATNSTWNVSGVGVYKVQVKSDDCLSVFSDDTPIIVTGDFTTPINKIIIFPNPASDYIHVSGIVNDVAELLITDMMGRTSAIVLEKYGDVYRALIDNFSIGVYVLRIQEGSSVHRVKFIKK